MNRRGGDGPLFQRVRIRRARKTAVASYGLNRNHSVNQNARPHPGPPEEREKFSSAFRRVTGCDDFQRGKGEFPLLGGEG